MPWQPHRHLAASAAILCLIAGLLLPPLHAHDRAGDDHAAPTVHRHVGHHSHPAAQAAPARTHSHPVRTGGDDDHAFARLLEPGATLSAVTVRILAPAIHASLIAPSCPTAVISTLPAWTLTAPPHAPPRSAVGLRAPPRRA